METTLSLSDSIIRVLADNPKVCIENPNNDDLTIAAFNFMKEHSPIVTTSGKVLAEFNTKKNIYEYVNCDINFDEEPETPSEGYVQLIKAIVFMLEK